MTRNKGGRPAKEAHEMRNKRVSVNFTEAEYNRATEKAKRLKMPLTEFLRKSAEGAKFTEVDEMKIESVRILASISNNINQMARIGNKISHSSPEEYMKILGLIVNEIKAIREEVLR